MIRPVLLIVLVAVAAHGDRSFTIPPDRSLSVHEYIARGMPDVDRKWTSSDFRQAWSVLQALYEDEPATLPRYSSGRSGPVFEKILDESLTLEALDAITGDLNVRQMESLPDDGLAALGDRTLVSVYRIRHDSDLLFDRELVEIHAYRLNSTIAMCEDNRASAVEIDQLVRRLDAAGKTDEANEARRIQRFLAEAESTLEYMFLDALRELAVVPALEDASRASVEASLRYLEAAHAQCQPHLSEAGAARARDILKVAADLYEARRR